MIEFKVRPDAGDPFTVEATSRDVVVWEKTGKGRSFSALMDDLRMGEMYRLAWIASRRLGLYRGELSEFETTVDLEFDVEEAPDPTPPGASTDE